MESAGIFICAIASPGVSYTHMKYRAFLTAIIVLGLIGTIFMLLQERQGLHDRVSDLVRQQNDLPDPIPETIPTELISIDVDSFYPRETISRESYRCEYDNCLFKGGGGLVGVTTIDAFYTSTEKEDMDGNTVACHALYVKRGPAILTEESKFSRFYNEDSGVLTVPIAKESIAHLSDWEALLASTPDEPVQLHVFVRDSLEQGAGPCDSAVRILHAE